MTEEINLFQGLFYAGCGLILMPFLVFLFYLMCIGLGWVIDMTFHISDNPIIQITFFFWVVGCIIILIACMLKYVVLDLIYKGDKQ